MASLVGAFAQTDDFDDRNDTGWTRYNPLASFGAGGSFTFPNGGYRLQAPPSPDAFLLGPARVGSLRPTLYSRFSVAVDLVHWTEAWNEAVGLIVRTRELGLGTTDGYTFNYNTGSGFLQINLARDERPTTLSERPFRLNPTNRYRLVFTGAEGALLGQVFASTNLALPLYSIFAHDTAYDTGMAGIFAFDVTNTNAVDATFDNYEAKVPETLRATVTRLEPTGGEQPPDPIGVVIVEMVDRETMIDLNTVQLEVDGATVVTDISAEFLPYIVTYTPDAPLAPSTSHRAKITFTDELGVQTVEWTFGAPSQPSEKLFGAPKVTGPYAEETLAVLDPAAKTFSIARPEGARFYRLQAQARRRISSVGVVGSSLVLGFE
jgi:hypothetical protein